MGWPKTVDPQHFVLRVMSFGCGRKPRQTKGPGERTRPRVSATQPVVMAKQPTPLVDAAPQLADATTVAPPSPRLYGSPPASRGGRRRKTSSDGAAKSGDGAPRRRRKRKSSGRDESVPAKSSSRRRKSSGGSRRGKRRGGERASASTSPASSGGAASSSMSEVCAANAGHRAVRQKLTPWGLFADPAGHGRQRQRGVHCCQVCCSCVSLGAPAAFPLAARTPPLQN